MYKIPFWPHFCNYISVSPMVKAADCHFYGGCILKFYDTAPQKKQQQCYVALPSTYGLAIRINYILVLLNCYLMQIQPSRPSPTTS